jgi:hypothetical protein
MEEYMESLESDDDNFEEVVEEK